MANYHLETRDNDHKTEAEDHSPYLEQMIGKNLAHLATTSNIKKCTESKKQEQCCYVRYLNRSC
jgi:hypothetical protein